MPPRPVAKGCAKIERQNSNDQFAVSPAELTWELVSKFGAKNEIYFESRLNHPSLGTLTWRLWQYPREARNSTETDVGQNTLIEDFDLDLETADDPKC